MRTVNGGKKRGRGETCERVCEKEKTHVGTNRLLVGGGGVRWGSRKSRAIDVIKKRPGGRRKEKIWTSNGDARKIYNSGKLKKEDGAIQRKREELPAYHLDPL